MRLMLLRQNIEDNEKECKLTYIDLLLGMLEDIPMGMLLVACCALHVARCALHVARCALHVARCALHVAGILNFLYILRRVRPAPPPPMFAHP